MDARTAERFAEGEIRPETLPRGEAALWELVQKSVLAPARLAPDDLRPVLAAWGRGGTLEILAVLASFHFINRIADLVGITNELPLIQRRFAALRRWGVRLQAGFMRRFVDLANRAPSLDVAAARAEAEAALGPLPAGFDALEEAPNVAGFLTTVAAVARRLDPAMVGAVTRAVASALPTCEEEASGFHPRPQDPVEALCFVGTRYAVRTTPRMVDAVREKTGWGDPELTDLFYAISMRNAFERLERLLGAPLPAA